ncbi:alpha-galactosidase [Physcia stellaris]|nr:alpha-galactosidase [Physcia stellaris]
MNRFVLCLSFVTSALWPSQVHGQGTQFSYNGLANTPQMGWDNWNAFGCDVSEELLLGTAQKIVDYGLRDLGYYYVILDDCWSAGRTENGTLLANSTKFPNCMKHVGDQLHIRQLKPMTTGHHVQIFIAASLGHEKQDAMTFASWGVDYLKYDNCYNAGQAGTQLISHNRYKVMSQALNETGRPILYSLCNWGEDYPWNWGSTISNSWRMSGDIYDSFDRPDDRCPCTSYDCSLPGFHCSVMNIINKDAPIVSKAQPGAWNDLDNLEVGNGGMTDSEYVLHFSMWAILKSPLIMGTAIPDMSPQTLSIYSNPAVIALSQDPLGISAHRVWQYPAPVDGYDYVVALLNAGNTSLTMNASLTDIFFDASSTSSSGPAPEIMQSWDVHDLWANRMDTATASSILSGNATVNGTVVAGMNSTMRYNSTRMSYAEGLARNESALLGSRIGSVAPMGTLSARVERHGIALYRLRPVPGSGTRKRDEL